MDLWESFERYMDERTKCNDLKTISKKKSFPNPVNLHRAARPGLTNLLQVWALSIISTFVSEFFE